MALSAGLAACLVAPIAAHADDSAAPAPMEAYAPISAVGVMLDTGQALIFDEASSKYRLVGVGDVVAGWKVVAILEDRVVLVMGSERDELMLTPLVRPPTPAPKSAPRAFVSKNGPAPSTIEGPAAPSTNAPVDPGLALRLPPPIGQPAPAAPTLVAPAPVSPAAPTLVAPAPVGPAAPTLVAPAPVAPAVIVPVAPSLGPKNGTSEDLLAPRKVARQELLRELGDFDALAAVVDVSFATDGGFVLTRVDQGSWPYRMGLRQGDIVRAVAGERLVGVDDAARAYAKLRGLRAFTVEIDRPLPGIVEITDPPSSHITLSYVVK